MTVSDICLEDSTPATSIVTISEVGTIILAARDMLRINDEMEVQVEIRDQSGNQFPVEQLGRMDLSAHTDNDIISVEKRDGRFLVRGTTILSTQRAPHQANGLFRPVPRKRPRYRQNHHYREDQERTHYHEPAQGGNVISLCPPPTKD